MEDRIRYSRLLTVLQAHSASAYEVRHIAKLLVEGRGKVRLPATGHTPFSRVILNVGSYPSVSALQAHSASAREVRRIAMEALEALFGLQLPLPPSTVRQYMQGIAAMMTRWVHVTFRKCGLTPRCILLLQA
jgi:hypothetical protein